jgi:hypothetical protein
MGKPIAYMGHKVQCPRCKGTFPIVEGALTTTFYGKGVALAGMKTACGAVLIASQFTDIVEYGTSAPQRNGQPCRKAQVSPINIPLNLSSDTKSFLRPTKPMEEKGNEAAYSI